MIAPFYLVPLVIMENSSSDLEMLARQEIYQFRTVWIYGEDDCLSFSQQLGTFKDLDGGVGLFIRFYIQFETYRACDLVSTQQSFNSTRRFQGRTGRNSKTIYTTTILSRYLKNTVGVLKL